MACCMYGFDTRSGAQANTWLVANAAGALLFAVYFEPAAEGWCLATPLDAALRPPLRECPAVLDHYLGRA
jgi:hypothetical protein